MPAFDPTDVQISPKAWSINKSVDVVGPRFRAVGVTDRGAAALY
jgi:hypothetical protein